MTPTRCGKIRRLIVPIIEVIGINMRTDHQGLGRALIALCITFAGCNPAGPEVAELKGSPAEGLPEQFDKAFANALHRVHLDASPPASCTDCHRLEDRDTHPSISARCQACHEGRSNPVHVKISPDPGRECLACHDFIGDFAGPWRCVDCHVVADPPHVDQAPITISVHSKEACAGCHAGHADVKFSVTCVQCHDQVRLIHRLESLDGNEACLECHGGHDTAEQATERCASCHEDTVSAKTLFAGHDTCTNCHQPHPAAGARRHAKLKTCDRCHDVKTMGAAEHDEHNRCASCHAPHAVKGSAKASCVRCHDQTKVEHGDAKAATCIGCHPPHSGPKGPKTCNICHEKAASETAFHAGETNCKRCHVPHSFPAEAPPKLCLGCHQAPGTAKLRMPKDRQEAVLEGHQDCSKCHLDAAHAPADQPGSCVDGECHAGVRGTSSGHKDCKECHAPHSGETFTQCGDCHGERKRGKHVTGAAKCQDCHRPHGPGTVAGAEHVQPCNSCHDKPLPGLHTVAKHSSCTDCHTFHGGKRVMTRSTCIGACHTPQLQHEAEAVSCVGCHPFRGW